MKKYMPLEGLRWSRDSGSALCDTPQNNRFRTGWGGQNGTSSSCQASTATAIAPQQPNTPIAFSPEAQAVMEAGKALWRYYHEQPEAIADAALYDIRLHFQGVNDKGKMNTGSQDEHYNQLMAELRQRLKVLAQKIEPKVYEYGFLKK